MDGLHERRFPVQPAVGVALIAGGIALLWGLPGVPIAVGIGALVAGTLTLIHEFI